MDDILVLNLRNILCCIILSTPYLTGHPLPGLYRVLSKIKLFLRTVQDHLTTRSMISAPGRFWEIDMTKFEP